MFCERAPRDFCATLVSSQSSFAIASHFASILPSNLADAKDERDSAEVTTICHSLLSIILLYILSYSTILNVCTSKFRRLILKDQENKVAQKDQT